MKFYQNTSNQLLLTSFNKNFHTSDHAIQNKACPIKLNVQYEYGQLQLSWDCTNVKCGQGTYLRAILIFDSQSYTEFDEIYDIAQIYYKRLKLGDFLKIVSTNRKIEQYWIERTSEKLNKQEFLLKIGSNNNLISSISSSIKSLQRYSEPGNISIFTKRYLFQKEQMCKFFNDLKPLKSFCYLMAIFFQRQFSKQQIGKIRSLDIPHYIYKNQKELEEKIKFFCNQHNKIRLTDAQINLKCITGDIYLKNPTPLSWTLEKSTLTKRLYALNNYTKYVCSLQVNSFRIQKVGFELQFIVSLVGGTKYKMQQIFYINVQNPAQNIQQARNLMFEQFRYISYSQLPKQLRIEACKTEKIMVTQKNQEDGYLSYQRQFFDD